MKTIGNWLVRMMSVGGVLIVVAQGAPAAELAKFEEQQGTDKGKIRQLTPYLDRWKTAENDTLFKDPNLQSKYQGDLPIYSDWMFLNLELVTDAFFKHRENPRFVNRDFNPLTGAVSPVVFNRTNNFRRFITLTGFELRNADDTFKPATWRARFIGAGEYDKDFNAKDHTESEHGALQEAFVEHKIFDLGELDLSFLRLGVEPFKSDFHGLIFFDNALSARMFGEYDHNKYRYNIAIFRPFFKDAHSNLNDMDRQPIEQYIGLASIAITDVTPGWNGEFSFHYNRQREDPNSPKGKPAKQTDLDAFYVGSTFNGRLGVINFNPAAYVVWGDNTPVQGQGEKDILAELALLDAAYTLPYADFITLRTGYMFQSGDDNPNGKQQHGFASINDNIALFGAGASYWTGEAIFFNKKGQANGGTQLVKANSAYVEPNNFDSPGMHLFNVGTQVKVTQRLDGTVNANYLMFAEPDGIAQQVGLKKVDRGIGEEVNGLLEWRPLQQNTFVIDVAGSLLFPDSGFRDVVGSAKPVFAMTSDIRFIY